MNSQDGNEVVSAKNPRFWRRHRVVAWVCGVVLVLLAAAAVAISILLHNAEPIMRAQIVLALERKFHARVELDSFHMSLTGGLRAEGKGLRIWPPVEVQGVTAPGSGSGQPLIALDEFRFRAPLHYKPGAPLRISTVELQGLVVDVPPATRFAQPGIKKDTGSGDAEQVKKALLHFRLDSIDCTNVILRIETSKPGKLPLVYKISSLKLTNISPIGVMDFNADLVNAVPRGTIQTSGKFGPWNVTDPGESAISGQYTFDNANLGDFKDIAGTLHSIGNYTGTMRDLSVTGEADVPNFALTHFGTALPLQTQFDARVDATDGDTILEQVNAVLSESHFTVRGQVVRVPESEAEVEAAQKPGADPRQVPPAKGHDISLLVDVPSGRMQDFIRLVSKSATPMLTGVLNLKTSIDIPPAKQPVHLRIKLKGTFLLQDALFTSAKVQDRVNEMSLRGQGLTKEKDKNGATPAQSAMQSSFTVANGVVTLPDLEYRVPGADVALKGTYGLDGGALDFTGKAMMHATVSKMLGGWKGALATPLDHFFKKDGAGTEVPVRIDGTRDNPHFGLDFHGDKHTSPQKPGENNPDSGPVKPPSQQ